MIKKPTSASSDTDPSKKPPVVESTNMCDLSLADPVMRSEASRGFQSDQSK